MQGGMKGGVQGGVKGDVHGGVKRGMRKLRSREEAGKQDSHDAFLLQYWFSVLQSSIYSSWGVAGSALLDPSQQLRPAAKRSPRLRRTVAPRQPAAARSAPAADAVPTDRWVRAARRVRSGVVPREGTATYLLYPPPPSHTSVFLGAREADARPDHTQSQARA